MDNEPMDMDSQTYHAGMYLTCLLSDPNAPLTDDERAALHTALTALKVTVKLRELCASVLERERYWNNEGTERLTFADPGKFRFAASLAGDVARGVLGELDAVNQEAE